MFLPNFNRFRHLLSIAAVSALLLTTAHAEQDPVHQEYEQAMEAAFNYQYGVARMHLESAARNGYPQAQRNLGLMYLFGERLYGDGMLRDLAQARQWLQKAAEGRDEVALFVLRMMAIRGQ